MVDLSTSVMLAIAANTSFGGRTTVAGVTTDVFEAELAGRPAGIGAMASAGTSRA